jgi:hypothetical protein
MIVYRKVKVFNRETNKHQYCNFYYSKNEMFSFSYKEAMKFSSNKEALEVKQDLEKQNDKKYFVRKFT